jgi:DNA polymerase-3 subunit gamma/tau
MSYIVLANKWRPKRFAELVGQQHVVKALVNALQAGRLHHAYLFSGTRGVGKTTVARILAKALNCEQGVSAEPCGECNACQAIDAGRFVDLLEVDAASRTKVDDTRELLDNVQYAPTSGRFKVYLIDEVHMLSTHSFNALLKTLEEPPPHVKFLLATTDPQKLPVTVLSRCLQFNLKRLTADLIGGQLTRICEQEGTEADDAALQSLARAAQGSMRDALSLLDQAIAFGDGAVRAADVATMLGTVDTGHVERLLRHLAAGDGAALLDEVAALDERAPDYGAVLDEVIASLKHLAVMQLLGSDPRREDTPALDTLAAALSPEDVQLYYQIALNGRRDLPVCADPRSGFEMTLIRMLAFRPATVSTTAERPPGLGRSPAPPATPREDASAAASSPAEPDELPAGGPAEPAAASIEPVAAAPAQVSAQVPEGEDWPLMIERMDIRGAPRQLAEHSVISSRDGASWHLTLARASDHLNTEQIRTRLAGALSEHLGRAVTLRVTVGETTEPTPADLRAAREDERMREARAAIEQDPNVRALQDAFDAVVEADTIQPIDRNQTLEDLQ